MRGLGSCKIQSCHHPPLSCRSVFSRVFEFVCISRPQALQTSLRSGMSARGLLWPTGVGRRSHCRRRAFQVLPDGAEFPRCARHTVFSHSSEFLASTKNKKVGFARKVWTLTRPYLSTWVPPISRTNLYMECRCPAHVILDSTGHNDAYALSAMVTWQSFHGLKSSFKLVKRLHNTCMRRTQSISVICSSACVCVVEPSRHVYVAFCCL